MSCFSFESDQHSFIRNGIIYVSADLRSKRMCCIDHAFIIYRLDDVPDLITIETAGNNIEIAIFFDNLISVFSSDMEIYQNSLFAYGF